MSLFPKTSYPPTSSCFLSPLQSLKSLIHHNPVLVTPLIRHWIKHFHHLQVFFLQSFPSNLLPAEHNLRQLICNRSEAFFFQKPFITVKQFSSNCWNIAILCFIQLYSFPGKRKKKCRETKKRPSVCLFFWLKNC